MRTRLTNSNLPTVVILTDGSRRPPWYLPPATCRFVERWQAGGEVVRTYLRSGAFGLSIGQAGWTAGGRAEGRQKPAVERVGRAPSFNSSPGETLNDFGRAPQRLAVRTSAMADQRRRAATPGGPPPVVADQRQRREEVFSRRGGELTDGVRETVLNK